MQAPWPNEGGVFRVLLPLQASGTCTNDRGVGVTSLHTMDTSCAASTHTRHSTLAPTQARTFSQGHDERRVEYSSHASCNLCCLTPYRFELWVKGISPGLMQVAHAASCNTIQPHLKISAVPYYHKTTFHTKSSRTSTHLQKEEVCGIAEKSSTAWRASSEHSLL